MPHTGSSSTYEEYYRYFLPTLVLHMSTDVSVRTRIAEYSRAPVEFCDYSYRGRTRKGRGKRKDDGLNCPVRGTNSS